MHLLYLDDSGSVSNKNERYLVLAGIVVFERQAHWLSTELDKLAEKVLPGGANSVEFHASEIFSGRSAPWKNFNKEQRKQTIKDVLDVLAKSHDSVKAFACAVHKDSFPANDPMEKAFEDLCCRFDILLKKMFVEENDPHRGIIILDKSSYETSLQNLALHFKSLGTQWGVLKNLAEVPLFVDSKASRLVQLADHVAYSVFRRYEHGDASYLDIILQKFDVKDGILHGLVHRQTLDANCMCPACMSRRFQKQTHD